MLWQHMRRVMVPNIMQLGCSYKRCKAMYDAHQLGCKHDGSHTDGPAAYAVGHAGSDLHDQPGQANQRHAEQHPAQGLSSDKGHSTPAGTRGFSAASELTEHSLLYLLQGLQLLLLGHAAQAVTVQQALQ